MRWYLISGIWPVNLLRQFPSQAENVVRVRAPPDLQQAEVQHPHQSNSRQGPVNNILSLSISGSQDSWTFLSEIFHQQSLQPHCLPEVGWFITTEILRNTRPSSTLEPLRRTCKTLQSNINNNNKELQDCQYIDDMVVTKNSIRWLSASSSIYMLIVIAKLQDVSCYFQLCDLPPWTEWLWLFLSGSGLQNRVGNTALYRQVKIYCNCFCCFISFLLSCRIIEILWKLF